METGQCVPRSILGPDGYLVRKQTHIEAIRLITDPFCDVDCLLHLASFRNLKSISWKGPRLEEGFVSINKALQSNKTSLEELELDFFDWMRLHQRSRIHRWIDVAVNDRNFFVHSV